ncbi:MAG TPA: 3-hydroxyacyl-CoA dehydrogenase NAD-binding domain-containing protein [Chthoniobacterales bacterium]|jgi:3-hydroxyacyl-CoA dehydrogenase/enoyl-CoA hydratase/3-hydroxybutyryl-CoA epimerase|nr:3-hydroxyacyl-CoA dehydrogenase NAD-binding domain-containing protein [Chthoniobacterales bacterium]
MNGMAPVATRSLIQREIGDDRVCVLTFDRPDSGANIFDAAAMDELSEHIDAIEHDNSLRGLIITSAKKSIFIAGADLKTLLKQAPSGEMRNFIAEGQRVFNRIAELKIPTAAAIHGACAGGGYEVTLACDWRVASDEPATRIGLPETTLGLIPAWGGSTRLPRLIGQDNATEVILKGKLYSAAEALKLGLVDEVVSKDKLLEAARQKLGEGKRTPAEISPPTAKTPVPSDPKSARARALSVITTSSDNPIGESLRLELEAIVDLGKTESTQNLIRNFFLAEKYKKGASKTEFPKVAHAAVVGAGVMGSGIAQWLSSRGVTVILRDVNRELLDRGLANIEKVYGDAVKRGLMSEEKAKQGRSRIVASTAPVELRDVEFIIEAASEKIDVKKEIFCKLSMQAGPKTIVATNTSALPVTELAECTVSPDHVIGLHFFNPVSRMKLIEVVITRETSATTKEQSLAFIRQIAKVPVVVRDSPGFLVNRVLFPYLLDAAELFEGGIDAEKIDDALTKWGMPMGPLRLIDEIGIDVTVDIATTLEKAYGKRDQAAAILAKMREAKMLGRKSGSGFYKYEGKTQSRNESTDQWRQTGGTRADVDLANRLMFLMVNEAARCVEEKVVESPEDADYGMILGTGFAPHRGGPLRFAEHFGLDKIVDQMNRLGQTEEKFLPCEILKKHARDGTRFYKS